jgi:hypothetical protein
MGDNRGKGERINGRTQLPAPRRVGTGKPPTIALPAGPPMVQSNYYIDINIIDINTTAKKSLRKEPKCKTRRGFTSGWCS